MSLEGQGDVTSKREWIAVTATSIKASEALAQALADHEKLPAVEGGRLSAIVTGEDRDYWTVADGLLDGAAVPDNLRFIYKGHWRLQPLAMPEAEIPEPVHALPTSAREAEIDAFPAEPLLPEPVPEPTPAAAVLTEAPAPEPEPEPLAVTPVSWMPAEVQPLPKTDAPKPPTQRGLFASFRRRRTQK